MTKEERDSLLQTLSEGELDLIEQVRSMKPYSKIEISMNQNGSTLSVIYHNSVKTIIALAKTK